MGIGREGGRRKACGGCGMERAEWWKQACVCRLQSLPSPCFIGCSYYSTATALASLPAALLTDQCVRANQTHTHAHTHTHTPVLCSVSYFSPLLCDAQFRHDGQWGEVRRASNLDLDLATCPCPCPYPYSYPCSALERSQVYALQCRSEPENKPAFPTLDSSFLPSSSSSTPTTPTTTTTHTTYLLTCCYDSLLGRLQHYSTVCCCLCPHFLRDLNLTGPAVLCTRHTAILHPAVCRPSLIVICGLPSRGNFPLRSSPSADKVPRHLGPPATR